MDSLTLMTAPGMFLAQVDEDIIVLDLVRDSYDCLFAAAAMVALDGQGGIVARDEATKAELISMGLAVQPASNPSQPAIAPARRELVVEPHPHARDICRSTIVLMTATLRFRRKTLPDLIAVVPRVRGPLSRDPDHLSRIVGAARVARTWIPFEGECLQRSFLLRSWLASQGIVANWIFGVRTWPFSAHCWLQIGDLVVGDRLERVGRYTPIMQA